MDFKRSINYFLQKPKTLFLLDGLGAVFTTVSLFFILRPYNHYFGMPANTLTYLSIIGLIYCVYSMSCFFFLKNSWTRYLRIIGIGNLLYCVLTMSLLYSHYNELEGLGLAYFVGEIVIIALLAYIELRVANILGTSKFDF